MTGLNLSFRVDEATPVQAVLLYLLFTGVLCAPLMIGAWYLFGSGTEWDTERRLTKLIATDPIASADEAFATGDRRFIVISYAFDNSEMPGIHGGRERAIRKVYDVRPIAVFPDNDILPAHIDLTRRGIEHAATYNLRLDRLVRGVETVAARH